MSDNWIPYTDGAPAFTVQRNQYGDVTGGDYVRADSSDKKAALRYGGETVTIADTIANYSLVTEINGYDTIDISWGWPPDIKEWASWELVIVRSCFGYPVTVNDGVTVQHAYKDSWTLDLNGTPITIVVKDTPLQSGKWYYYTLFFNRGLEWVAAVQSSVFLPADLGHTDKLWQSLPPYYRQRDDFYRPDNGYLRQFLSVFGAELDGIRGYVDSWLDMYHIDTVPIALLRHIGENLGLPYEAGLGDIRYRHMVARLAELHSERGTPEGLRLLVEAATKYRSHLSVGENLMLLNDDSEFAHSSGNWVAFPGGRDVATGIVIEPSGDATVTGEAFNATVDVDGYPALHALFTATAATATGSTVFDSAETDFGATTFYAGVASATSAITTADIWTYASELILEAPYDAPTRAENAGQGVMRVSTTKGQETAHIILSCGYGSRYDGLVNGIPQYTTMVPESNGIPVIGNRVYGFQFQYSGPVPQYVRGAFAWFSTQGQMVGVSHGVNFGPGTPNPWVDGWRQVFVQAESPATAQYAIPLVIVQNRQATPAEDSAPYFYMMGAMVYYVGEPTTVGSYAPDFVITLSDDYEYIGDSAGPLPEGFNPESLKTIGS
jgi:hypothetical protein